MSEEMAIEVFFARDLMKDFLNPDGTVNNGILRIAKEKEELQAF